MWSWVARHAPRRGFLWCAGLLGVIYLLLPWKIGVVAGDSMDPTLRNGKVYILERARFARRPIQRGDIVVFDHAGATYVKRVAAVGGDRFTLFRYRNDTDDVVLEPKAAAHFRKIKQKRAGRYWHVFDYQVPEGCYYVLGDNRNNSLDSRNYGLIPQERIRGRVLFAPTEGPLSQTAAAFPIVGKS